MSHDAYTVSPFRFFCIQNVFVNFILDRVHDRGNTLADVVIRVSRVKILLILCETELSTLHATNARRCTLVICRRKLTKLVFLTHLRRLACTSLKSSTSAGPRN